MIKSLNFFYFNRVLVLLKDNISTLIPILEIDMSKSSVLNKTNSLLFFHLPIQWEKDGNFLR